MATSRLADQIGRVLGGRYRIVEPIGTGASAHVFVADDVTLRRRVAVKILHPALAGDEAFLRRFRAEAQAAAAVNHPNIMRVYDWGEDADGPFLVMEYLGGGSLRDLLDTGARLTPSQAAAIGIEAARALDHAHRRGFVHRDIKPANLLFDDEGRLVVADFGLARALAEAAWTEPSGAMLGTARYASPEQARGLPTDGRADVYALALVIVESVTGRVPFAADTTISTLMARVDAALPIPPELTPIAAALERAAAPDADERADAAELGRLLHLAAGTLPAPAPLPLAGTRRSYLDDTVAIADPTELGGSAPILEPRPGPVGSDTGTTRVVGEPAGAPTTAAGPIPRRSFYDREADADPHDENRTLLVPAPATSAQPAVDGGAPADPALDDDDAVDGPARPRARRWLVVALVLVLLLAAGVVAARVLAAAAVPRHPVPTLTGLTLTEARAKVEGIDARLVVADRVRKDDTRKDDVIAQSPRGGEIKEGGTIRVTVSDGQTLVAVPDLAGLTHEEIQRVLTASGLLVGRIDANTHDENVPKGVVLSWAHQGEQVEKGTTIDLRVSAGPAPRSIPEIISKAFEDARKALNDLGFKVKETRVFSDEVPEGRIVSVSPAPTQQAPFGSEVTVTVSKGPDLVAVPDVRGMDVEEAEATLNRAGLAVAGVRGSPSGRVNRTDPATGQRVKRNSEVTLFMTRGDD